MNDSDTAPNRRLQFTAFLIVGIFLLGFVFASLGAWTGAVLGAWFVGTQKPWRGFWLLAGINLVLSLFSIWRAFEQAGVASAGWTLLAVLIGVVPFLLYRLASQRSPTFLSTLLLPLWGIVIQALSELLLPAAVINSHSLAHTQPAFLPLVRFDAILGTRATSFFIFWFAAAIVWMWNQEFRAQSIAVDASIFGLACLATIGYGVVLQTVHAALPEAPAANHAFVWICLAGALVLSLWNLASPDARPPVWANKTAALALLRSPYTGDTLKVESQDADESLVSTSGERFPILNGIPVFVQREKLTGSNEKYNRLYESIGGIYDDFQRVWLALHGLRRSQHFRGYLRWLEIKPGDRVLETSVGTGLNFQYLQPGARLFGLDLSAEMLANCQVNLRRWTLDADLVLGNAEELPFADESFDCVFHVGGINFFNDRAKAIREMIRVAKPGTRILIADETEKHVKDTYERVPVTSRYFKHRQEAVAAPIDLVPAEMREINLEILRDGSFYALTFRKPPR